MARARRPGTRPVSRPGGPALPGAQYRAWAAEGRPGDWSARGLRARCAALRDQLAARGDADEAALDAAWPGGADNQRERGVGAWIVCYGRYTRLLGAADARRTTPDGPEAERALAATLGAALADQPAAVPCADGVTRYVYPKSYHALEQCQALDLAIGALGAIASAQITTTGEAVRLAMAEHLLRAEAVRVWVWIVTHPAADVPFAPEALASGDVTPPTWTATLAPSDLLALTVAFRAVNRGRLAVLGAAFPPCQTGGAGPSRLRFEGFLGAFAGAKAADPLQILRAWSVTRVVATAVSEALAHQEAEARATAAAGSGGTGRAGDRDAGRAAALRQLTVAG